MKYIFPSMTTVVSSFQTGMMQYFLDGQQLTVFDGENYCGRAINDTTAIFCLSGPDDVSAQLTGLTLNSTVSVPATIVSCEVSPNPFNCPGTYYACVVEGNPFGGPQCITSISNGDEQIICDSSICTF